MIKLDRLSGLIHHFSLNVAPATSERANFIIFKDNYTHQLTQIVLAPKGRIDSEGFDGKASAFYGWLDWGGQSNPLLTALPESIALCVDEDSETKSLALMLISEYESRRCGGSAVLNRLSEILLIKLLRKQLEKGCVNPGLLSGLADERLSRSIVAMHDHPGKKWTNEDLADAAGLSMSRFYDTFKKKVGLTPMAYLRKWRMILARQDVERGERIQVIAKRYCYGSAEALSRSFVQEFGNSPMFFRTNSEPPKQQFD